MVISEGLSMASLNVMVIIITKIFATFGSFKYDFLTQS